jgi:hypothetical protein
VSRLVTRITVDAPCELAYVRNNAGVEPNGNRSFWISTSNERSRPATDRAIGPGTPAPPCDAWGHSRRRSPETPRRRRRRWQAEYIAPSPNSHRSHRRRRSSRSRRQQVSVLAHCRDDTQYLHSSPRHFDRLRSVRCELQLTGTNWENGRAFCLVSIGRMASTHLAQCSRQSSKL